MTQMRRSSSERTLRMPRGSGAPPPGWALLPRSVSRMEPQMERAVGVLLIDRCTHAKFKCDMSGHWWLIACTGTSRPGVHARPPPPTQIRARHSRTFLPNRRRRSRTSPAVCQGGGTSPQNPPWWPWPLARGPNTHIRTCVLIGSVRLTAKVRTLGAWCLLAFLYLKG